MDRNEQVETMLALVQGRLRSPIDDPEELERLRNGLERVAERAAALREFPLTNADEPDFVFSAYRAEWE